MSGIDDLIIVGDRVLIRPDREEEQTRHGLYLPAGVQSKEKVQAGRVLKAGPGYPIPNPSYLDAEPWSSQASEPVKYVPLQAEAGDYALFMREKAIEIEYEGEKLLIVPQSSLLVLVRGDPLDALTRSPSA